MKRLICCLLMLMVGLSVPVWCEEESSKIPDVDGLWRFHLRAGARRKSLTMKFEQKEDRLEGWLYDQGRGHPKIKGKIKDDHKIVIWTKYVDRSGSSEECTFRGKLEGDQIVGKCDLWRKSYEFVAKPVEEEDEEDD